ncbi:MAG: hypothetical protein COV72_09020 [Candidatus Omnitrophica bacterium CG11_big_fil_rev_8_21_14_0_20_42_13]|uniref:Zinc-finger domain-containing protein n=1 Tax=Candidatus Ghiorseimicrobium undicola TaxID=1974746 RepID=A0A2H0LXN2_9BACT|nr:MAG: hypothetical protein COV72_09020 [Candidatus Omnitrophica bacterium CG11_big_fil_rev_8_21_14_0_20_42_13]
MDDKEGRLDRLIKESLEDKGSRLERLPLENCPSELELSDYLGNRLSPDKQEVLLAHVSRCRRCLSSLALAHEALQAETKEAPNQQMLAKAKDIYKKKPKNTVFNYRWQILAFISFVLSFLLSRYFLQFLVLAAVFSLKWILDSGSTRTLIMIYEAWRGKGQGDVQRIIRGLRDKIEQRR